MSKKANILILISIWPIIGVVLSLIANIPFILSTFIFYTIPSIILFGVANRKVNLKVIVFALIIQFPIGIALDYILTINSWSVVTIFPIRLFDLIPIEDIFWGFSLFVYTIAFYEYFFDVQDDPRVKPHLKPFFAIYSLALIVYIVFLIAVPEMKFAYILHITGIPLLLIPIILFLVTHKHKLKAFLLTGMYFFVHSITLEVISLRANQWNFHGTDFIGWVSLFGVRFPFEEFFYWFVLLAMAILVYYEFFWDDRK